MAVIVIVVASILSALTVAQEQPRTTEQIIKSYVEDFRSDRFAAEPMLFGITVPDEGEWHVDVKGEKAGEKWVVELLEGPPPTPTFVYRVEGKTLRATDQGRLNPITAQGKAFSDDYAPMEVVQMEGYAPSFEQYAAVNPFSFHFWTRGFPEVIPFGEGMTRKLHGSNIVGFYYEPGLRTVYSRIEPGTTIRDDPREQAMPFPILIVVIGGTAEGNVDGQPVSLSAGNAVFVPPFAPHRWWNDSEEAAEAILIMFGDGA